MIISTIRKLDKNRKNAKHKIKSVHLSKILNWELVQLIAFLY